MSYSRWGGRGSGHWYTYCLAQSEETENRDTAIFEICGVTGFTAKRLRNEMDICLDEVRNLDDKGDLEELAIYMKEFLDDVDREYPEKDSLKDKSGE